MPYYLTDWAMWRKRHDTNEERERFVADPVKARDRTMNRAVKLLAAKPRSVGELRARLLEKLWTDAAIVDAVIEKLKEYGYLDDQKFAGDLALSKLRRKPQGRRRLKQALSNKGLGSDDIQDAVDAAFEKMPESDLIEEAIDKRIAVKGRPESREELKRFLDYLLRLGFDYEHIRARMDHIRKGDRESI
ncbi:MAG: regulatory protein RecX [Pyrinomonadaceae bacterium]